MQNFGNKNSSSTINSDIQSADLQSANSEEVRAKESSDRIQLYDISKSFDMNGRQVTLFSDVNLTLQAGHSYAITGPSGAGKSSLLMLMSGLEPASSGTACYIHNEQQLPLAELKSQIGFVFQQFHLLPELTALHNVALPLKLRGIKDAEQRAVTWLEKVGLGQRMTHKPGQLSGGEQQRVAIARALVFEPGFIFADEPTGNLDADTAAEVADILFSCCQQNGAGLVLVTHSDELAARAEFQLPLKQGRCQLVNNGENNGDTHGNNEDTHHNNTGNGVMNNEGNKEDSHRNEAQKQQGNKEDIHRNEAQKQQEVA